MVEYVKKPLLMKSFYLYVAKMFLPKCVGEDESLALSNELTNSRRWINLDSKATGVAYKACDSTLTGNCIDGLYWAESQIPIDRR